jgi:hypothetical protein
MLQAEIIYAELTAEHFDQVIALGNQVHGEAYLTPQNIADWTA